MTKRNKITWLGNKHKKEFHRVVAGETHPRECHLASISEEHRQIFPTATAARKKKFDAAAPCTVKFKSRQNT
jgi:hypothetical protein